MGNPYDDDISQFSVVFTRAVIAWNGVEHAARSILRGLSGGGIGAHAAILHLGNVALNEALLTAADHMSIPKIPKEGAPPSSPELAEHVQHFVEGMDIMRAYRNFYVHSLFSMGKKPDQPEVFHGLLIAEEAKGKLTWIEQNVSTAEMFTFLRWVSELHTYGFHLSQCVNPNPLLGAYVVAEPERQPSSLEKPTWPERLKKNRKSLTGR